MHKRVLCIDCQVFQTPAWDRGMGKYSLNLLRSFFEAEAISYDAIELLFNTNLPELSAEAEQTIQAIAPRAEQVRIKLALPSKHRKFSDIQRANITSLDEQINVRYSAGTGVDYLMLSLFLDETCAVFPSKAKKILLFYDLIPLLYHARYERRIPFDIYLGHFRSIFQADLILTISQTVSDDLAVYLGIPQDTLRNIDGASIDRSRLPAEKPKFDVPKKYILMPTGDEIRKNNLRAVKGFEEFIATHGQSHKLIITSRFSDDTKRNLRNYSDNLIFTDNLPEPQLQWLYEHAELLLFASEYEGLGLPVLEGVSVNKPIACSNIPVFREISPDAFYFFDHLDSASIARTIAFALTEDDWPHKSDKYASILKKYRWSRSAKLLASALAVPGEPVSPISKKRLAVFTPHPAGFSAIGKVTAESHASLSRYFDVDYYFDYGPDHRVVRSDYLSSVAPCYDAAEFSIKKYQTYDAVVYHIGNSEYHLETIKNSLYLPGYTILHDTFLEGAYKNLRSTGYISDERFELEATLNDQSSSSFLSTVVNGQRGILVHSEYAAKAAGVLLADKAIPVSVAQLPVGVPERGRVKAADRSLNVGLAGILADVKGLGIINALVTNPDFDAVTFHIFGHAFGDSLTLNRLGSYSNVRVHTNPTDFEFQTELAELDVLLNYRLEYRGETSLTVLEAMRNGVAVIVRDVGWYSELPDDAVVKVDSEEAAIEQTLRLVHDAGHRTAIGTAAYELVRAKFTHEQYAKVIVELLEAGEKKGGTKNDKLARAYRTSSISKPALKRLLLKFAGE